MYTISFTVDALHRVYVVIVYGGATVMTEFIGRATALQWRLGCLNKDHYRRLCPVYNDGIVREMKGARVMQLASNARELRLWFPSIPYQTFSWSTHGYYGKRANYYGDNKFWRAYEPEESHNCPLNIGGGRGAPAWIWQNLEPLLHTPQERRTTVHANTTVTTPLEAWEMSCGGYIPVVPKYLRPSQQHDTDSRLLRQQLTPKPCRLAQQFTFRWDVPYADPSSWAALVYVQSVYFDVEVQHMYAILNLFETQGRLYPKVKEVLFGPDTLVDDRRLFEILRFFPRVLCVRYLSNEAEIEQMGTEVCGLLWHPTQ